MAKKMTPAQRRQHYDAWRVSGMSRAAYARQHGINNKTFWHLCRAFSADDARGPAPADNRPAILPVTATPYIPVPPVAGMLTRI